MLIWSWGLQDLPGLSSSTTALSNSWAKRLLSRGMHKVVCLTQAVAGACCGAVKCLSALQVVKALGLFLIVMSARNKVDVHSCRVARLVQRVNYRVIEFIGHVPGA